MPERNPQSLQGLSGTGKKNTNKHDKWSTIIRLCEKYDIVHILQRYKDRISSNKRPKIHHLAWKVFADYILLKKSVNGICTCITSGAKARRDNPEMQPGHFRKQGESLKHKFNEDNVRPQTMVDNVMKDGNYQIYTLKMIDMFGRERVDTILKDKEAIKIKDREYVEMIKKWFDYIDNNKV